MRWSDRRRGRVVARGAARAAVALAVIALAGLGHAGAVQARSTPLDDCIQRKVDGGMPRSAAMAECVKEVGPGSATTVRPTPASPSADEGDDESDRPAVTTDDGGTSVGALLAVGLGGLVVGAGLAAVLLRRRAPGGGAPALGAPVGGMPPRPVGPPASPFAGPPGSAPAPAAAPAPADRGPTLIVALIDLADRVNSQALRADILAALARVGVQQIDVPAGEAFDANRMRGVGSAPTADRALVGRVAATDRPGFRDGPQLIRLPDVVVHVAG